MKLYTAQQMRLLDEHNISNVGMHSLDLMENAAIAVVDSEVMQNEIKAGAKFVIFCGPGNNGGDGLAIARLLLNKGCGVEVYLFNPKNSLSADCDANKEKLKQLPSAILHEITQQFDLPSLGENTVIVDALFGTGLSRPLAGGFASLVEYINACGNKVVSVDMPSGMLDVEVESRVSVAVKADYTLTFHAIKPAMLLADNQQYLGKVCVLDIGLTEQGFDYKSKYKFTTSEDAKAMLHPRDEFAHKGTCGHALLVAGSQGMCGAAILAAKAALRSGLGKITVHTPQANRLIMQIAVPEAILSIDNDDASVSDIPFAELTYKAVGFGPGVGLADQSVKAFSDLLHKKPSRLVVDADGLNILANHRELIAQLPQGTILTPHRKEMERLLGSSMSDSEMLRAAMKMCSNYGIIIVLKGRYTAVCTPKGEVFFNTTGNSGMATAGSGDVLTGIVLSLLAQGYCPEAAARLGVWLHGKAGDMTLLNESEESLIASDIISNLGAAFILIKDKDSFSQHKII